MKKPRMENRVQGPFVCRHSPVENREDLKKVEWSEAVAVAASQVDADCCLAGRLLDG